MYASHPSSSEIARACCGTAIALGLAVLGPLPVEAATVAVRATHDGEALDIHASAIVTADLGTAWRVLTDYPRYPEFIPGIRASRVVARRGATVTVAQSGEAALWFFSVPVEATFEIDERPPGSLLSRTLTSNVSALTSRYQLTPTPAGLQLDYTGRAAPGAGLLGALLQGAIERNAVRQLQALADEIERQGARH